MSGTGKHGRRRGLRAVLPALLLLALIAAGCGLALAACPSHAGSDAQPAQASSEPEPEPEPGPEEQAQALLAGMTLQEKVLQLFIVMPEQLTGQSTAVTAADDALCAALAEYPVGGVVFFASNLETPQQVCELLAGLQSAAPLGLFLAVDEEGGTVARMGRNAAMGMTRFPNMGNIDTTDAAYNVGRTIGSELAAYGFNLDFAPVADVNSNPANPVIGSRAFSSEPETAAELVAACVGGFRASGMLCTLKHFPGHGDTATDSHYGAAVVQKTMAELEACELLPFRAGIDAGAEFVMVGHLCVPAVTGDQTPASLSPLLTTGLLRDDLGFGGLVITDSMQMKAVTGQYSPGEAAVLAIQAGADIILMPEDLAAAADGLLAAVERGDISEQRLDESVLRVLRLKIERGIITPQQLPEAAPAA